MTLQQDLAQFTGTENWYKHPFGLLYTDGIKYLADQAGAYWLIDAIASYQPDLKNKSQTWHDFQLWQLSVNLTTSTAVLTCQSDSGEPAEITQEFEFTDFPLESIKLYCCNGVLLLPSEY